jgi:AmmeMemoRadiSam system protein A
MSNNSKEISDINRKFLLELARKTISAKNSSDLLTQDQVDKLDPVLKEKRGCFVTLNLFNNLRGCIGYILPIMPLYQAVIDNAYNAAYSDPRFPPVSDDEIKSLHMEISVLTVPQKLSYNSAEDLLNKLVPLQDGVILKKGFRSSTFLPQVWEQLPDKKEFLGHLCMKAGLKPDEWTKLTLDIETYKAEVFEEIK